MGASGAARLASLAGFNLGVELGQAVFVAAALAALALLDRCARLAGSPRLLQPPQFARFVAGVAFGGGALLLAQRLG